MFENRKLLTEFGLRALREQMIGPVTKNVPVTTSPNKSSGDVRVVTGHLIPSTLPDGSTVYGQTPDQFRKSMGATERAIRRFPGDFRTRPVTAPVQDFARKGFGKLKHLAGKYRDSRIYGKSPSGPGGGGGGY